MRDRHTRVTGRFWTAFLELFGLEVKFSVAKYPHTEKGECFIRGVLKALFCDKLKQLDGVA